MAKKPVFLDDVEWGNIELEGFSDEQLFDPLLNRRLAMKVRSEDPEFLKNTTESNRRKAQDPKWLKKTAKTGKRRAQDPKWQKNTTEANKRKAQDPKWQAAHKAGIRLHQGRAIVTPEGQFDSIAEAVDYYLDNKILPTRKTRRSVRKFLDTQSKKEGSGFYYEDTR